MYKTVVKLAWVERRRLAKRQVSVSKPNLHHEPSNGPEGPFFRAERPKGKKQPGETRGRDGHEKNEFGCHGTERAR